jgi:hypothetical protein
MSPILAQRRPVRVTRVRVKGLPPYRRRDFPGGALLKKTAKTKTSLMLASESKHKLSTLKADLRLRGLRVTESEIVDGLITATSADALTRMLKK